MFVLLCWATFAHAFPVQFYPEDEVNLSIVYYDNETQIFIDNTLIPAKLRCTGSMRPLFGCKDTVLFKKAQNIEIGDVVAYDMGDHYILHQIIGEIEGCYILKGANNLLPDARCVRPEQIKYEVAMIVYGGME